MPGKTASYFRLLFIILIQIFVAGSLFAQDLAEVYGKITDTGNQPVPSVNIALAGQPGGTVTKADGSYSLKVPANRDLTLLITFVGFNPEKVKINLSNGERKEVNRRLSESTTQLPDFVVEDRQIRSSNLNTIDPKLATMIPSASGGIEALLKTLPGVSSNSELSSQYSVRGGNYDENLVYVNDIEIYKPFLVRSGQQEGLSFLNSDLTASILFSAGGFEARYGDKLSSVLDIRYKRPTKTAGSVSLSLLGASMHIEGSTKDRRLMYLFGVRQKSNQYILKSMETKGDYKPSFTDLQGMLIYELNPKLEFSILGNYARNSYIFEPVNRETSFGTINEALQLRVYFEGSEVDRYINYMGAFTTTYKPVKDISLKLILSSFQTSESETYDIMGQYWIGQLETDQGSDSFGEATETRDIGTYLDHARNYLDATVSSIEHRGTFAGTASTTMWGIKFQHEIIADRLNEWSMNDSAGFTLPTHPEVPGQPGNQSDIVVQEVVKTRIDLSSNRFSGFLQKSWEPESRTGKWGISLGARWNYWDLNKQFLFSPRGSVSYKPDWKDTDIVFRFSTGLYYQPPFYRELRNQAGEINPDLKAQTSIHFVAGSDLNFRAWGRPFKFVTEAYYKYLDNLVPYDIDNVRIRYYATNSAKGYAAGIDLKVNGEFVKGVESWASMSLMQTREDIAGDTYTNYYNDEGVRIIPGYTINNVVVDSVVTENGYMPRPTDQLITFGLFFQDYLPKNPTFKMNLSLLFGSGLPFSPPGTVRGRNAQRMPPFRRVDIGFSKQIVGGSGEENSTKSAFMRNIEDIWISLEVLNLLQVNNTISYTWVKDVNNRQYGVPNYMTPRQLNIRVSVNF
ncbi:MAG: carboxypeptidase-like regulatory domain-containing protein [Bacteroidales bacterium]|nr:carboxypeptidase-like regulatory domain-containing protein [Bacteroidales bacterium]